MTKSITILGSTGSIGASTLDVIGRNKKDFIVKALTANNSVDTLYQQCMTWSPDYAVLRDEDAALKLSGLLKTVRPDTEVLAGVDGLNTVAGLDDVDYVVAGIVGAAGLLPTLAAVNAGKRVLLANKESLVMSGQIFMQAVKDNDAVVLPVDSEHNAIFQCLPARDTAFNSDSGINRILLTASGGPFRALEPGRLGDVTPEQAIKHPNWEMGRKISVDSATMMNKGLEVIEARWLFNVSPDNIEVIIHPQSIIHSMVSYKDGSVLAQLGNPDMRTPIAHALAWPERIESGVEPLDITSVALLEFEKPDIKRYPCLDLCQQAVRTGGAACVVLNAANEIAVSAFLDNLIPYTAIAEVIEHALQSENTSEPVENIEDIMSIDGDTRTYSKQYIVNRV